MKSKNDAYMDQIVDFGFDETSLYPTPPLDSNLNAMFSSSVDSHLSCRSATHNPSHMVHTSKLNYNQLAEHEHALSGVVKNEVPRYYLDEQDQVRDTRLETGSGFDSSLGAMASMESIDSIETTIHTIDSSFECLGQCLDHEMGHSKQNNQQIQSAMSESRDLFGMSEEFHETAQAKQEREQNYNWSHSLNFNEPVDQQVDVLPASMPTSMPEQTSTPAPPAPPEQAPAPAPESALVSTRDDSDLRFWGPLGPTNVEQPQTPCQSLDFFRVRNHITIQTFELLNHTRSSFRYQENKKFGVNLYEPAVNRKVGVVDEVNGYRSKKSANSGNYALCPFCPLTAENAKNEFQKLFFKRNDSNYLHHMIQFHGVFSNGERVKDPKRRGWMEPGDLRNCLGPAIDQPVEVVQCPYCDEYISLKKYKASNPDEHRLLKYLRHVKEYHKTGKNLQKASNVRNR